MWIAFPSAKRSLNVPWRTGTVRFSPTTVAWVRPTHGRVNLPFTEDPAEPAKTKRLPLPVTTFPHPFPFLHLFLLAPAAFLPFAFLHFFFDLHLFPAAFLPVAHFTIAVVPAPCDQPELTVGELSTGASCVICELVRVSSAWIARVAAARVAIDVMRLARSTEGVVEVDDPTSASDDRLPNGRPHLSRGVIVRAPSEPVCVNGQPDLDERPDRLDAGRPSRRAGASGRSGSRSWLPRTDRPGVDLSRLGEPVWSFHRRI